MLDPWQPRACVARTLLQAGWEQQPCSGNEGEILGKAVGPWTRIEAGVADPRELPNEAACWEPVGGVKQVQVA